MEIRAAVFFTVLLAGSAFGQSDRVLRFAHTEGKDSISEIATLIRVVADVEASGDLAAKTLTVHGAANRMGVAEWLFHELDRPQMPPPDNRDLAAHEFQLQAGGENTVRLFYLTNTESVKECYWIATGIRTTTDMMLVGTYAGRKVIAARGTPDQIALAAWTVGELDRPAGQESPAPEYPMIAAADPRGETAVRIFQTRNAATVQDFQEIASAVRKIADIRRVYAYNPSKAFLARATPEQIALAGWLLRQLDQPPVSARGAKLNQGAPAYEYDTPYDPDNMIRVFFLPKPASIQEFQEDATSVRNTTGLRRVFTYNAPRAIAVRGTAGQLTAAERLIQELSAPR